jgi:DNA repair exonuclease SbcCD nuclease subunit
MKKLVKGCFHTDIHFGKKTNSPIHNQDCLDYLDWFCAYVKSDPTIDYVAFLGDWNETRAAINLATLNFSYYGAKKLNDLGLPVFFVVGNHDLYHRHTREVYSVLPFAEFSNFRIISEPTVIPEIGDGAFFSPYLFHDEYDHLEEYLKIPFWAGHFEFKGFRVTGYNMLMPTGPDHKKFAGPKHILSGHFHQRQQQDNIAYIGNCFPMDFGDAGDFKRGLAVYDHITRDLSFKDWKQCPKYMHVKLSTLLDGNITLPDKARIKCKIDEDMPIEELTAIKEAFIKKYNLRELTMEETSSEDLGIALRDTDTDVNEPTADGDLSEFNTVDDLVIKMLSDIAVDQIDNALLIEEYRALHD